VNNLTIVGRNSGIVYPYQQAATVGSSATFMCNSASIKGWHFLNHTAHPINVKISGVLNKILTVKDVKLINAGIYKCYHELNELNKSASFGTLKVINVTLHEEPRMKHLPPGNKQYSQKACIQL